MISFWWRNSVADVNPMLIAMSAGSVKTNLTDMENLDPESLNHHHANTGSSETIAGSVQMEKVFQSDSIKSASSASSQSVDLGEDANESSSPSCSLSNGNSTNNLLGNIKVIENNLANLQANDHNINNNNNNNNTSNNIDNSSASLTMNKTTSVTNLAVPSLTSQSSIDEHKDKDHENKNVSDLFIVNEKMCPTEATKTSSVNSVDFCPATSTIPNVVARQSSTETVWVDEERTIQFNAGHNSAFHRRFPQVESEEKLIDYFSCALLADILIQGFLYITENYFGFYSNIFGFKTKLLIQVNDVRDITKEKIALVIPNAIGIETINDKYVFGSLFSRDTTYRLMVGVWKSNLSMNVLTPDQLPSSLGTDNEIDGPITRACEALLEEEKNNHSSRQRNSPSLFTLSEDVGTSQTILNLPKSASLQRSIASDKIRLSRDMSDSSDSDSEYDSTGSQEHSSNGKLINRTKSSKSKKRSFYQRNLYSFIKKIQDKFTKMTSIPFVYIVIVLLLIYLTFSTFLLIHRITALHEFLNTATPARFSGHLSHSNLYYIKNELEENLGKIEKLKTNLMDILSSIDRISSSCQRSGQPLATS